MSSYVTASSFCGLYGSLNRSHRRRGAVILNGELQILSHTNLQKVCENASVKSEAPKGEAKVKDSDNKNGEIRSEADKIVDGMNFGDLCNEFECVSSPQVESTARQLARDILELKGGDRSLSCFAVSVSFKDPVRRFNGRENYKRPLWATSALESPKTAVQEMEMLSTSVLNIKWTIRGKPKLVSSAIGELEIRVNSIFTLNQISGQVIEHEESWEVSGSSVIGQAFFWISRRLFAAAESRKDFSDSVNNMITRISSPNEKNADIYPTVDPTKFFQRDDGFQRDAYQIALVLAIVYFVIQFLKLTL